jgi:dihydrolipoamide dehydrogenase
MAERFDLAVIGGGPGGYVAAIRAAQLGLKVALVEKEQLGGVCLNRGCIPTKALLGSAGLFSALGRAEEFGVKVEGFEADVPAMFRRKDEVVARLRGGVETLLRKRKVTVFPGVGSLGEPGVVGVEGPDGTIAVECERIILATGSTPLVPETFPYDGRVVVTTREALESPHMPDDVLIIGAGAVGCEFAGFYSSLRGHRPDDVVGRDVRQVRARAPCHGAPSWRRRLRHPRGGHQGRARCGRRQ